MQKGREDLWTYFTGSYVDRSDDVLWFRDPTGRREVSFVYDWARHRIVDGDVRGFDHKNPAQSATISIELRREETAGEHDVYVRWKRELTGDVHEPV
jgi:hypothetical protein